MAPEVLGFAEILPQRLASLSDGRLLAVHASFVKVWQQHEQGQPLPEGLNREEVLNRFAFVVAEFSRRPRLTSPDAGSLDEALAELGQTHARENLQSLAQSGAGPHPMDLPACQKLFGAMPAEITLREDFIRFGGEFFDSGEGSAEAYIQDGFPDSSRELKLYRVVHSILNRGPEFTLCPDGFPESAAIAGYDLVLRKRRSLDLNIIEEPEFQASIYGTPPEKINESQDRRRALVEGLVDFVVVPAFVSVSGSFVYHDQDRSPRDIDIIVKDSDEREDIQELLGEKIQKVTGLESHWVWEARGPNWSAYPLYDLVCRARRDQGFREQQDIKQAIALKVPDPKFVLDRLAQKKEVILLTGQSRGGIAGSPMFLINERLKKREGIFVWAVVTFDQEPDQVGSVKALGKRVEGLDELTRREFEVRKSGEEGPFFVLKLRLIRKFARPIEIKKPPPGRGFGGLVDLEKDRLRAALQEEEDIPKLENKVLNLRPKDFPQGKCGLCRYFVKLTTCKILVGPVAAELVCDGFQGIEKDFPLYKVQDEDWLAFVKGMIEEQPYQHIVVAGHLTPEGPIVIIKDTVKPKPHIFSLSKAFHVSHSSVEHHWEQGEVDQLIQVGKEKLPIKEAFHIRDTHWVPIRTGQMCPVSHPTRLRSPEGEVRCYTRSAAQALRAFKAKEGATFLGVSDSTDD